LARGCIVVGLAREVSQFKAPVRNLHKLVQMLRGTCVREGALRERESPAARVLVTLAIEAGDADASGFEPVKCEGRLVGYTTSGTCGHHVGQSLALAYVDRAVVAEAPVLTVDVVGETRAARILPGAAWDPRGERLRS
jgi:dimethylglycine dehydrogenase